MGAAVGTRSARPLYYLLLTIFQGVQITKMQLPKAQLIDTIAPENLLLIRNLGK